MHIIRLGARLRVARKASGYRTAKAFILKHKIPASTYSQHESGARMPDEETLKFYSKKLGINFDWLRTGQGNPYKDLTNDKKNVIQEESLLVRSQKEDKVNQPLLIFLLKKMMEIKHSLKSELSISMIVKDAISLHNEILAKTLKKKTQMQEAKKAINIYKNKF